jgi:hypothetical protein
MSSSGGAGGPGGDGGPTEHTGNTAMFAVFMLAIYSLGLFPYTLYRLCSSADDAAQPVAVAAKVRAPLGRCSMKMASTPPLCRRHCTRSHVPFPPTP